MEKKFSRESEEKYNENESKKEMDNEKIEISQENAAELCSWRKPLLWYHVEKHDIHENREKSLEDYCIDNSWNDTKVKREIQKSQLVTYM